MKHASPRSVEVRPHLLSPIVARGVAMIAAGLFVLMHGSPALAQKAAPAAQEVTATKFIERVAANNPRLTISEADVGSRWIFATTIPKHHHRAKSGDCPLSGAP